MDIIRTFKEYHSEAKTLTQLLNEEALNFEYLVAIVVFELA